MYLRKLSFKILLIFFLSCQNSGAREEGKGVSEVIYRDGSFLNIDLVLESGSLNNTILQIFFENKSSTMPVIINKLLIPDSSGKIHSDIFSVFNNTEFSEVKYIGTELGKYYNFRNNSSKYLPPVGGSEEYIVLNPSEKFSFQVNFSDYYDFSEIKKGSSLFITYKALIPLVNKNYKQEYAVDSIDDKKKPIYLDPFYMKEPDSCRVYFSI